MNSGKKERDPAMNKIKETCGDWNNDVMMDCRHAIYGKFSIFFNLNDLSLHIIADKTR